MAYSYVNRYDNANQSSATSLGVASVVVLLHDTLVVEYTYGTDTPVTETCSDGTNIYTRLGNMTDGGNGQSKAFFVCKDAVAGTYTVTAATGASSYPFRGIVVSVYNGLDNSATPQFTSNRSLNAGTGTDAVSSTTVVPSSQPAMVYGGVVEDSGGAAVPSAGSLFTTRGSISTWTTNIGNSLTEDRRITSTSAVAATWTASTGTYSFLAVVIVILEASGSSPTGYNHKSRAIWIG